MDEASEPVQTEGETRRAHELALLVDSVRDYAILLLDEQGTVMTWNVGAERLKGYVAAEIVGRSFATFSTDEDRARDQPAEALRIARRDGRFEDEGWRVRRDGSRFWANVVITTIHEDDGTVLGFGTVVRDLSARRRAHAELEQFRRLVLSVGDYAIFLLDPGGHVATWNAGAQRAKGYAEADIVGRHFSVFYTDEDRARDHPADELRIATATGRYEEEGWRVRQDGTRFWASVVITAVRDDEGALVGYAKVTRDLSERRKAEQALRDANHRLARSNQELDRFAAVAAHDLQEPLRTIAGFSGLLQRRHAAAMDEDGRGFLDHIAAAVDRMQRLVDDLLGYARAAEPPGVAGGRPVAVAVPLRDATVVVLDELRATIDARGATIAIEIGADVDVRAEARDIEAVLRNLLSNAVKFADAHTPSIVVRATPVETSIRVDVIDNGIGIDPADRPRLFLPFQRLHSAADYPGTGLGLAIAQRVVERNGGAIGVDSVAGEGSRFWFTLPAAGLSGA